VWQARPFAIAADKEARGLLRPRCKTAFTGYLIVRLGADITVNQHFAFRHHCGAWAFSVGAAYKLRLLNKTLADF